MDLSSALSLVQTAVELGLFCSLTVLALFLSYSMLNVCDLSTDGCFTLGAAVGAAVAIADLGGNPAGVDGRQPLSVRNGLPVVAVCLNVLGKPPQLLLNRLRDHGAAASQIQGGRAGEKVDELISVHIGNNAALSLCHHKGKIG